MCLARWPRLLAAAVALHKSTVAKVVPISGALEHQGDEAGRPAGPWLFYPELGLRPGEKDAQRVYKNALRAIRLALQKAGLPAHYTLHSLRHTFGSGLISRGV